MTRDEAALAVHRILIQIPVEERYALVYELNEAAKGAAGMNENLNFQRRREEWRRLNAGGAPKDPFGA